MAGLERGQRGLGRQRFALDPHPTTAEIIALRAAVKVVGSAHETALSEDRKDNGCFVVGAEVLPGVIVCG